MFSNTFAGIAPSSAPPFIVAQVVGGAVAVGLIVLLYPGLTADEASDVVFPHDGMAAAPMPAASDVDRPAAHN